MLKQVYVNTNLLNTHLSRKAGCEGTVTYSRKGKERERDIANVEY